MSDNGSSTSPSDDNSRQSSDKQKPLAPPNASRPGTASTVAREGQLGDPFATPDSSRPPSLRQHQNHSSKVSQVSFSDASSLSIPRTPTEGVFPSATSNHIPVPRSILSNPSSRVSVLPSARSSAIPLPSGIATPRKLPRMKSHMITDRSDIPKPWKEKPNPRAKIAYFLTYAVILLGIAGGAVQCYFSYARAQLDKKPLCLVMEENFDSEDAVFGENGSFNREVTMDGFGYVRSLLSSPTPPRVEWSNSVPCFDPRRDSRFLS